jgi:flavin reductase (DIM6/NTAB) family NADH-FMN oxidoreductase RutF
MIGMTKIKIRPGPYVFPGPTVLVGANVHGKPNFNAIGWIVGFEFNPPLVAISSNQRHNNNVGIKENQTFSVNTPSEDMVQVTDYCGIKSGRDIDKSKLFDVFYGELKTAPMIKESPLNLECKVVHKIDTVELFKASMGHDIFFGEVIQVYTEEKYLTNNQPDVEKIKPFILSSSRKRSRYYKIGEELGVAWSIGNEYKKD